MKLTTYEKFLEENGGKKEWYPDKLKSSKEKYPFTVIVEGYYPEGDFAVRWCWQQFGPYEGQCCEYSSEYPACPKVLAIEEYVIKKSYVKDGVTHEYDFHTRDPGTHNHEGTWTLVWLGKTDYDYGFTEYCFANEADRDAFVAAAPSFRLGENYED